MEQFESFIGVNFWTALFILLNTLAIYLVAKKYLFAPVQKIITARQQEIDGMYADADKAQADSMALKAEYERKLSDARATSENMVKEAVTRGRRQEEEILRQANAQASAIMTKASADAAMEKKRAINGAKDEIAEIAVAIASRVMDRAITDNDQAALVDHFIDELGDKA